MKKTNKQLMEDFKKLEAELVRILKINDGGIASELGDNPTKAQLESYIKKVNRASKIFAKYEAYSNEISKRLEEKQADLDVKAKLAEKKFNEEKEKYEDEVIIEQSKVKVVKKKKKVTEKIF